MKQKTVVTDLICSDCGTIFPISRKEASQRNNLHIKDLFCYKCNKITKFIELKDAPIMKKTLEFKTDRTEYEEYLHELLCRNDDKGKNNVR